MLTKAEILLYSKLNQKKYRKQESLFVAEGKRLVQEGLNSRFQPKLVGFTQEFADKETEFISNLKKESYRLEIIRNQDFLKITSTKSPQGILAVFEIPSKAEDVIKDKLIIGLENISDPGNLGTILRSCVWFGIKTVIINEECADIYNPKVLRASMGAVFKLDIREGINLINSIDEMKKKDYHAILADMNGKDYRKADFNKKTILTFCNEANGPSQNLKDICDSVITIPQKGDIESLNVAAAAAVILSVIE